MCQSGKGYYMPGMGSYGGQLSASTTPMLESVGYGSGTGHRYAIAPEGASTPGGNSQVSALTQRIISEVYMAAAKAASIAVSATSKGCDKIYLTYISIWRPVREVTFQQKKRKLLQTAEIAYNIVQEKE